MLKPYADIINAVFDALHELESFASSTFTQGMNYMVMTFLYDQFNKLSEEFSKCIGDQGEFNGNFEQFRRRHQAISRSVQEADRFLRISNVACFCCQIVSIIAILYSTIFHQDEIVSPSTHGAVVYFLIIAISVFSLSLVTGLAIIVNHAVSIFHIYYFIILRFDKPAVGL